MTAAGPRRALPARVRSGLGTALLTLPDPVLERFFSGTIGYTAADVPAPITVPHAERRLLVAPANYAAQGYAWARAAETLPDVAACNLFVASGGFGFPSDYRVSNEVFQKSHRWGREQARAVTRRFTHVLVEAERPVLGRACRGDVRREHDFLRGHGVRLAYVAHGSDVRLPEGHRQRERWSPYADRGWPLLPALERAVHDNLQLLAALEEPLFVSTPDLLLDVPRATWLPCVVEQERWAPSGPLFTGDAPCVVHAPTSAHIKGSALIEPTVHSLHRHGVIRYRELRNVPANAMPATYATADIVLDQFRLGAYGVAAIEAMSAGRLVIGHNSEQVRAAAQSRAGVPLPIVEATVDTLADVLEDIAARPDAYAEIAAQGPAYVGAVHTTAAAATILQGFLGSVP